MWAFVAGLELMLTVPLIVLGATSTNPQDRVLMFVAAGFLGTMTPIAFIGVAWLMSRRGRHEWVVNLLEALRAAHGGSITMPSALSPGTAPRLSGTYHGVDFTVFVHPVSQSLGSYALVKSVETPHAQSGAELLRARFRITVEMSMRVPAKLYANTRTRITGMTAGLQKLAEFRLGRPELDDALAFFSDQPQQMAERLAGDPELLESSLRVIQANPPMMSSVGWDPDGARWTTVAGPATTADMLGRVLWGLGWAARRLGAP